MPWALRAHSGAGSGRVVRSVGEQARALWGLLTVLHPRRPPTLLPPSRPPAKAEGQTCCRSPPRACMMPPGPQPPLTRPVAVCVCEVGRALGAHRQHRARRQQADHQAHRRHGAVAAQRDQRHRLRAAGAAGAAATSHIARAWSWQHGLGARMPAAATCRRAAGGRPGCWIRRSEGSQRRLDRT